MSVNATVNSDLGGGDRSAILVTWAHLLTATPDGAPFECPEWADLNWQAVGAAWGAATLSLQGSNDGVNWFTLSNVAGATAATFTADGGKSTIERTRYVRPNLTTPGSGADITVTLCARRATPNRT